MYQEKVGIENVQIINSSGEKAQQDVFHTHYHIVPRNEGDGQDIKWKPRIEIRDEFEELLEALK